MDLLHNEPLWKLMVALLFLYKSWSLIKRSKNGNKKTTKAPEPRGALPLLGHLHHFRGGAPVFRTFAVMANQLGPVFSVRIGAQRAIVVSSKEAIRECFTTNDSVFLTRPKSATLRYMGYNGALFGLGPSGEYWHRMHKMTSRDLLSGSRLNLLSNARASDVDCGIKDLYSLCTDNGSCPTKVDLSGWFREVTVNMILSMVGGKGYGRSGGGRNCSELQRFRLALNEFVHLTAGFEVSDVVPQIRWLDLQGRSRSMKRIAKEMDYFLSEWLEEHVQNRREGHLEKENDFLDVMLSVFAEEDSIHGHERQTVIKATALLLLLAGSETPAITMTWALSLLLNHREVLKRVQEEIDFHIGREKWVEEADMKNLVFLQAVVKETLRLYPPGPLSVPREALEDCNVAGYHVPKGTCLIVNLWKLHRDPCVWVNPDEFKPEKFLSSHAKVDVRGQQYEYLPYSSGRRMCPGVTASLQMVHLVLARLLQGFNLGTPMDMPVDMTEGVGMALSKAAPLEVILSPRLFCKIYE